MYIVLPYEEYVNMILYGVYMWTALYYGYFIGLFS